MSLAIWIYLLVGRGRFWSVRRQLPTVDLSHVPKKRVAVVIPARNEADVVSEPITSLLVQNWPTLHVYLVDDASSDATARVAYAAAEKAGASDRLTVIKAEPLPAGWTGKLWAVHQGTNRALAAGPDYLLLTDADIRHGATSIAELVSIAESGQYDLASYMVQLACSTNAEKALIPAFVFFFLMLYPPAWISSSSSHTAGAAGGCILIRAQALRRIGGVQSIRNEVIDDCALARAVKRSGGKVWMGLTDQTRSVRSYGTFGEIEHMIARTAFNQLHHSGWLLLGTVLGLCITYLAPPLLLLSGRPAAVIIGAAAWALMALAYLPMVHFYRQRFLWSLALPAIAAFYLAATVHSAFRYWRGVGGTWKGRVQDTPSA